MALGGVHAKLCCFRALLLGGVHAKRCGGFCAIGFLCFSDFPDDAGDVRVSVVGLYSDFGVIGFFSSDFGVKWGEGVLMAVCPSQTSEIQGPSGGGGGVGSIGSQHVTTHRL